MKAFQTMERALTLDASELPPELQEVFMRQDRAKVALQLAVYLTLEESSADKSTAVSLVARLRAVATLPTIDHNLGALHVRQMDGGFAYSEALIRAAATCPIEADGGFALQELKRLTQLEYDAGARAFFLN